MGTECYNGLTIFYLGGHLVTELTEQQREQARVDTVIKEIDRQIEGAKQALAAAHQETRAVEQNYSENASINRYEIDDNSANWWPGPAKTKPSWLTNWTP